MFSFSLNLQYLDMFHQLAAHISFLFSESTDSWHDIRPSKSCCSIRMLCLWWYNSYKMCNIHHFSSVISDVSTLHTHIRHRTNNFRQIKTQKLWEVEGNYFPINYLVLLHSEIRQMFRYLSHFIDFRATNKLQFTLWLRVKLMLDIINTIPYEKRNNGVYDSTVVARPYQSDSKLVYLLYISYHTRK